MALKLTSGFIVDTNLLLLITTGLGNTLALIWCFKAHHAIAETGKTIHRCAVHQRELAQLLETHNQLAELQGLTETAVHSGTSTIRSIHREIANIPFEILENIPTTRDTTRVVRGVHDITADGVYASITTLNKMLGKRLRNQMKLSPEQTSDNCDDENNDPGKE